MNKSIIDDIIKLENLHWAWEKAKSFYQKHEHWYDQIEIASFTANYQNELESIVEDIQNGNYTLAPIKPIFFPKGANNGEPLNRQMFWISVRDQVVWLAVMNIIGKYYDKQMPFWSYGNRLYVSMFPMETKKDSDKIIWGYGPYRNTTTNTYRSFQQSWPRFRKDVYLTAKLMTSQRGKVSKEEDDDIKQNEHLSDIHQVKYKKPNYWKRNQNDLYWCSIDLSKFYPNSKVDVIERNFQEFGDEIPHFSQLAKLLTSLLTFQISYEGLEHLPKEDFEKIGLGEKPSILNGIPTGLFSAGFLANIAMLKVDNEIQKLMDNEDQSERHIAHFRFVDDHTFLSTDPQKLLTWVELYKYFLDTHFVDKNGVPCVQINWEKTKPDEYGKYLKGKFQNTDDYIKLSSEEQTNLEEQAIQSMRLDPHYPSTLMNLTLEKMSMINNTPFDLLDAEEGKKILNDLEHLLVTDFPDEEIRKDTRVSYAASRLAQLTSRLEHNFSEIYMGKKKLLSNKKLIDELEINLNSADQEKATQIKKELAYLNSEYEQLEKEFEKTQNTVEDNIIDKRQRVFKLLIYAIHKHPDKLRLWKNALLFCEQNGFSEIHIQEKHYNKELQKIWDSIEELFKTKLINYNSKLYLQTFFYDLISHSLIRVYKVLKNSSLSYREINRKCSYLNQLLDQEFLNKIFLESSEIYYFKQSQNYLKTIIGTIIHLLNQLDTKIIEKLYIKDFNATIKTLNLLDWNNKPLNYLRDKFENPDKITWSMIEKISNSPSNELLSIVPIYLHNTALNNSCSNVIAATNPNSLNLKNILEILSQNRNPYFPFSWWYDVLQIKSIKIPSDNIKNVDAIQCIEYLNEISERKTIFKLFDDEQYQKGNKELITLDIIKQILEDWSNIPLINMLSKKQNNISTLFPYNVFFNNLEDSFSIKFHDIDNIKIEDKRYFPDFVDAQTETKEEKFIFAIGILMFQLVTGTKNLPLSMYIPGTQLFNLGYFLSELERHPVSSYTVEIIESCISKRKRETRYLDFSNFDNDSKDVLIIFTIRGLLDAISEALSLVELNKYTFDNKIRYLVPISLNQIKKDVLIKKDD